jgi:hypothetical protein
MAELGMTVETGWFRLRTDGPLTPDDKAGCVAATQLIEFDMRPASRNLAVEMNATFGGPWQGFTIDGWGDVPEQPPIQDREYSWAFASQPLGYEHFLPPFVRFWRIRATHPDTPLYAGIEWRPSYPWPDGVIGNYPHQEPTDAQQQLAYRGLDLLWRHGKRTRRGPIPDLTDEELDAALLTAIRSEWARLRDRPTLYQLAMYFDNHPALPRQTEASLGKRIGRAKNPPISLEDLYRRARPPQ